MLHKQTSVCSHLEIQLPMKVFERWLQQDGLGYTAQNILWITINRNRLRTITTDRKENLNPFRIFQIAICELKVLDCDCDFYKTLDMLILKKKSI